MRRALFASGVLGLIACHEPKLDREAMLDPETCRSCHPDHVDAWSGSMHAYAADDPVFRAMNARGQRETQGELGDFCVACHAPMAVREGATTDGLDLDDVPAELKGVGCFFCHSVDEVEGDHGAPSLHLADDLVMQGEYADAIDNDGHASSYSTLHDRDVAESARLCGVCHEVVTPAGAPIERTFTEWQASVFAGDAGATCGQCHLDRSTHPAPIADYPGVYAREVHSHATPAVDLALSPFPHQDEQRAGVQAFLDTTLQSALCSVQAGPSTSAIRVILDNVAAGHAFPSGAAQDRRLWIEVIAYQGGVEIYRSGVVPDGTAVTALGDPDLWLLRECMADADGDPVDMFWEAADVGSTMLPAQATFDPTDPRYYQTHVVRDFPKGSSTFAAVIDGVPDRITLRVRLQPIGLDVLDSLVASGDLDPTTRDAMTTFDLDLGDGPVLEWTPEAATATYVEQGAFTVKCVTASNLNVAADKVPAPTSDLCSP